MAQIFSHLSALSDPIRSRILLVLDRHELTVSELCTVLQLPQSTVSRHLKVLGDEAWVSSRADGTSRRYQMLTSRLDPAVKKLWQLVRDQVVESPTSVQDSQRLQTVLTHRRTASQEFFSSAAGQWDRMRSELFGNRADIIGLLSLIDPSSTIADLGCGTGQISDLLAPYVNQVIAVDESAAMLATARKRLQSHDNVIVKNGDLMQLPIPSESLDAALLFFVLHYAAEPAAVITEAARTLKSDGRLLIVDLTPHDRPEFRDIMGHVWPGFSSEEFSIWAEQAGLAHVRYHTLPPDPAAKGPSLFAASARRPAISALRHGSTDAALPHSA